MSKKQSNGAVEAQAFDWERIVDDSVESWPEPTPLAEGHYQFKVKGGKLDRTKGRSFIALQPLEPMEDVDRGKLGDDYTSTTIFATYNMARHEDVARLKQVIRAIGLGELSINDALKAMKDSIVAGRVEHSPRDGQPTNPYVNVRNLGPVAAA